VAKLPFETKLEMIARLAWILSLLQFVNVDAQNYVYASAALSLPYGPGLTRATIGEPTVFYIQAVNSAGQNITQGASYWKIKMYGPNNQNSPKLTTTDFLNGTTMVSYTIAWSQPAITGLYTIEITTEVNGQKSSVRGSPYTVNVIELAPIDPSRCHTRTSPALAQAGTVEQFTVIARDSNGNTLTSGTEEFQVSLSQAGFPVGAATTRYTGADGEYAVEFVCTKSSVPLTLSVKTGSAGSPFMDIAGSPFTVFIQPGPLYPANCDAIGAGVVGGTAGQLVSFLIIEQDAWNNDRGATTANAQVSAYFTGSNTIVSVAKNKNGTWTGTYTMPSGDKYLNVKIDGVDISGSPFLVRSASAGIFSSSGGNGGVIFGVVAVAAAGAFCLYRFRQAGKHEPPHIPSSVPSSKPYQSAHFDSGSDSEAY
jgi:hypothetical protein